jgi:hypothetical protein
MSPVLVAISIAEANRARAVVNHEVRAHCDARPDIG